MLMSSDIITSVCIAKYYFPDEVNRFMFYNFINNVLPAHPNAVSDYPQQALYGVWVYAQHIQ